MPTFTLKKSIFLSVLLLTFFSAQSQEKKRVAPAHAEAAVGVENFKTFTSRTRVPDKAWLDLNREYAGHPDAALYPRIKDDAGMVELYAERTRSTKFFINPQRPSEFVKEQCMGAIHFQKNGQWVTIDTRINPAGAGIYEASRQEEPVGFDVQRKASYIKARGGKVYFNNWELYGEKNGTTTLLAKPNWSNFTVGDDGMYITNIFPGIDATMSVKKGSIKTNFIIGSNQFAAYTKLKFKDAFSGNSNGSFSFVSSSSNSTHAGDAYFKMGGKDVLCVDKGIVYTQASNVANAGYRDVAYDFSNSQLTLAIDASYINTQLAYGKIVVDPLVQTISVYNKALITGSMNCGSTTNTCNYIMPVTPPAGAVINAVAIKFQMFINAPLTLNQGFFKVVAGTCGETTTISTTSTLFGPGYVYTPDSVSTPNVAGFWDALSATLLPCMPAPACPAPTIPFTLRFWNSYCAAGPTGCSNLYVYADSNFSVRIRGNTLDAPKITRSSTTPICQGASVTLGRTATFGVPPYTFTWLPGGQTTQSITVSPTTTTTYTSIVKDSCGNTITDTTTVAVITQNIPPAVVSPQTVCQFGNTPLTAVGTNLRWFTTPTGGVASTVAPVPPNIPGTYNYYVSSLTTCGETPRAHIQVTVNPKPAPPTVISPQSVCQYAPTQLTATGQNLKWYVTPTGGVGQPTLSPNTAYVDSFYYYVTQTVNGCESDRARIRLYVNYKPNGVILASRLFVCEGDTASFMYYGNALPDAAYNWSITGGIFNELVSGQGTQGPVIVRFDSAGLREVRVQVNNRGCLSDVFTQTLTVRPNPRLKYVAKQEACQDEVINVALSQISPLIDSFHYSFPNAEIVYGAGSGGPYGIRYRSPGNYVISSKSYARECPSRFYYDTIIVHPLPDVRFSMSKNVVCAGDSVLFNAANTDSNTQFYWMPDNFFSSGHLKDGYGVVKNTGYITLRAVNEYGCQDADSLFIRADACCEMFFPNAFSPNGDGKNEIFKPVTLGHQEIKTFRIINRWGQVVFETKQDRAGWNGKYNGRDQDNGTYYYFIRYKCQDSGDDLEQKGEVILVR